MPYRDLSPESNTQHASPDDSNGEGHSCACRTTGTEWWVTTISEIILTTISTLPCRTDSAPAAVEFKVLTRFARREGVLGADLRVVHEIEVDVTEQFDEFKLIVGCHECFDSHSQWCLIFASTQVEEPVFRIECLRCAGEIPFGWSVGRRIGRITPVNSAAFRSGVTVLDRKEVTSIPSS